MTLHLNEREKGDSVHVCVCVLFAYGSVYVCMYVCMHACVLFTCV